ncbi:MAG: IclR family transcriptional regulator [Comamonadaceae bacterium]|nr:MAG: IclR family transcriptional regulator [Comamonadaceae bacterium]
MATKTPSRAPARATGPGAPPAAAAARKTPRAARPAPAAKAAAADQEPAGVEAEVEARQSALARGIGVLRCFTTSQPALGSKELIERSGLPKPTAFRTIQTLRELGLLQYSEQRGRYMLAPGVLALCAPLLSGMTIRSLARPMMQELAEHAQGQVSLVAGTVMQRPLFVEICQGRGNTVFRPELGTTTSLSRSSSGRAWLVLLDEPERERHLRELAATDPERAKWLRPKLEQTRKELETQRFCRNMGELDPITVGVAVPVHVPLDGQYFVFGCTVPSFRLVESPQLLDDLGMRLAALVQNVEGALGAGR